MVEFHTAFRPSSWDDIVGQEEVAGAVRHALENKTCRCFIFTGEVGTGKTTLARVIANHLGVATDGSAYTEYDGATNTGVDDMRAILEMARTYPLGGGKRRVIVIDECHMLSKAAWNSALKSIEEPPAGVHWIFCTSEPGKVPASIRSRCQEFLLKELSGSDISDLIDGVLLAAGKDLSDPIFDRLVSHARGNPRRALVGLGKVISAEDGVEAQALLERCSVEGEASVIDLCRSLADRQSNIQTIIAKVLTLQGKTTAEGIRNVVCSYFTKVAGGKAPGLALNILKAFGTPYPSGLGQALYPVLVSIASIEFDD
jgi:DNA polymerase-3 subunit gamma/tau